MLTRSIKNCNVGVNREVRSKKLFEWELKP